jgi:hypothetical protein
MEGFPLGVPNVFLLLNNGQTKPVFHDCSRQPIGALHARLATHANAQTGALKARQEEVIYCTQTQLTSGLFESDREEGEKKKDREGDLGVIGGSLR